MDPPKAWAMWDSKLSLSSEIGAFNKKEQKTDPYDLEKSECKKQSTTKLENVLPENPPNSVPFQNQGLFFSYQAKNDLNHQTSSKFRDQTEGLSKNINPTNDYDNLRNISSNNQNIHKNMPKDVSQPKNRETVPKGVKWNDNLETNGVKTNQYFTGNDQNFKRHYARRKISQQIIENSNAQMNEQCHGNIPTPQNTSNNQFSSQNSKDRNHQKKSILRESPKKAAAPSMTILSQVTSYRVVTPEKDVETRKTVKKSWTTDSSMNKNKSDDVLFEHITRKPDKKKMMWVEDICTVDFLSSDDDNTIPENNLDYVYIPSKEIPNSRKPDKAPRPRRRRTSANRKPKINKYIPNEAPPSSTNAVSDHTEEFIRGQYRFQSEFSRRKVEKINIPNRRAQNIRSNTKNIEPTVDGIDKETYLKNFDLDDATINHTIAKKVQANEIQSINGDNIKRVVERDCACGLNLQITGSGVDSEQFSARFNTRYESHLKSSPKLINRVDIQIQKSVLIHFGEEISDSIVGSYAAMNMFLSFYNEWKNTRVKAIQLLENITSNISNTSDQRRKKRSVIEAIGNGGRILSAIPDPRTVIIGRIVAALSDFFAKLFGSSPTLKQSGMNEFELMLCLQQDIDATSDMNIYGIQCDQNFKETCAVIENFHKAIQGWCLDDLAQELDAEFLKDMSTMNPKHPKVYYRRLCNWMRRLAEAPSTDISRAFTRGFKDFPEAVDATNLLPWRFHAQGIDQTVSLRSWEEIRGLLQNGDSVTVEDVLYKIQNSTLVLIKERSILEKDVMGLLDTKENVCLANLKL